MQSQAISFDSEPDQPSILELDIDNTSARKVDVTWNPHLKPVAPGDAGTQKSVRDTMNEQPKMVRTKIFHPVSDLLQ